MTKKLLFQTMFWLFTKCWIQQHCWNCVQHHLQTLQSKAKLTQKDFVVLYPEFTSHFLHQIVATPYNLQNENQGFSQFYVFLLCIMKNGQKWPFSWWRESRKEQCHYHQTFFCWFLWSEAYVIQVMLSVILLKQALIRKNVNLVCTFLNCR
jgi:hypothetical protein